MNLVIDIGNTQIKKAIFDNDQLIEIRVDGKTKFKAKHVKKIHLNRCIISSVKKFDLYSNEEKVKLSTVVLNHTTPIPIKNKYKTPKTLGNDRLANAVGATLVFPKQNVLVIDMGTCIKYDFIDKKKNYLGGAISPGFEMRFKAMNHYTDRLPLIKPNKKFSLTGNDTQQSMLSGVQNGIIFEINGMIERYEKKYNELKVIITGGDHTFFADHLKSSIFAAPNLTLEGLNEILNYNVGKKT